MDDRLFTITEHGKGVYAVEWTRAIPAGIKDALGTVSAFLQWAGAFDVAYKVRPVVSMDVTRRVKADWMDPRLELTVALGRVWGEYRHGILTDCFTLGRVVRGSMHSLVHHGLDGLPLAWMENEVMRDPGLPIFRVQPDQGGVFSLTMADWLRIFSARTSPSSLAQAAAWSSAADAEQVGMDLTGTG